VKGQKKEILKRKEKHFSCQSDVLQRINAEIKVLLKSAISQIIITNFVRLNFTA